MSIVCKLVKQKENTLSIYNIIEYITITGTDQLLWVQ